MKKRKDYGKNYIIKKGGLIFSCLFWLFVWYALVVVVDSPLLLPSPIETLRAFLRLASSQGFYADILWTLLRVVVSVILSFAAGVALAGLAHRFSLVKEIFRIPVSFFKAVPVMAVIIYLVLLLKADAVAVAVAFVVCFPIVYSNALEGLKAVDVKYLELGKILDFNLYERIRFIYVYSLFPQLKAALELIGAMAWKAVVAAEVLSVPAYSMGYRMLNAKYYLDTPGLFVYIISIVLLGLIFEKAGACILAGWENKPYSGFKVKRKVVTRVKEVQAPTVELKNVSKSFEGERVLDHVTLELEGGKATALTGASGIGKTTIARLIAGLERPDEGNVENSNDATAAFLFQEDRLLPWFSVRDNMALALRREGEASKEKLENMAKALEIYDRLDDLPESLSGGMKHRVALGRTLLWESKLIILDEPFRGVDKELRERIVDRLWDGETEGKTVLIISHRREDIDLAHSVIEI